MGIQCFKIPSFLQVSSRFLWFDICISNTSVISLCLSGGIPCSWQNFEIYAKKKTIILNISYKIFTIFDMLEIFSEINYIRSISVYKKI